MEITDRTSFEVRIPTRIEFGWGKINNIEDFIKPKYKKILIIVIPWLKSQPFFDKFLLKLKKRKCCFHIHSDLHSDPDTNSVDRFAKFVISEKFEIIIALGGGSAIDFAKATAIAATQPGKIWEYVGHTQKKPRPIKRGVLPVIAIPTTAGTGSEVTPYAILTNSRKKMKATISSHSLFPAVAIVDPSLTLTMPSILTAATGVDAFAHALETFLNTPKKTPFLDMVALHAMKIIKSNLPTAVRDGQDHTARCQMSWGSLLGGIAIASGGTGICHGIAQVLGGHMGISHGEAVAAILPGVLKIIEPNIRTSFNELRDIFEVKNISIHLKALFSSLGLETKLKELGVEKKMFPEIIKDSIGYMGRTLRFNPRILTSEDVEKVLEYCW